jgi:DNA-binding CsgD family transcriptional regulator
MKYLLAALCLVLVPPRLLFSQTQVGTPQIINYSSLQYKAGTQNWDMDQDSRGILYFGNNEGLLTFNGRFWNLYPLPNKTVIRSLEIDPNGRIYVGGQDEVGYFFPDQNGKLIYHSLKELIPEKERRFADIWNIQILDGQVFFHSIKKILHLKDGLITVERPELEWSFMGMAAKTLFAQERKRGLMSFRNGIWAPVTQNEILKTATITSVLELTGNTFLITTLKHGLFMLEEGQMTAFNTPMDHSLQSDRIYSAVRVNKDWYALGTTSGGVLVIDKNGSLVRKYAISEGIQKNNIRSLFIDNNQNLWLGLDDGIDFIAINSAIKQIFPDKDKQATSYAIRLFRNKLYIGTSNGLYESTPISSRFSDISLSPGTFTEVMHTKGQVWGLNEINNNLMLAHEDGAFVIKEKTVEKVYGSPGTWLFQPLSNLYPAGNVIAGTYSGLQHLTFSGGKFQDKGKLRGIDDPLRFALFDAQSNSIWASHPYHGVYKIDLSSTFNEIRRTTLFTHKQGLPSALYNYVFRVKNRLVVATSKGLYEYNQQKNVFIRSPKFYEPLKDLPVQYLKEDPSGNIWFSSNKQVGVIDFSRPSQGKAYTVVYFPDLSSRVVGGFETIYPVDENNIFIGANKGVFHINYEKYLQSLSKANVLIASVKASGRKDSLIFGGYFLRGDKLATTPDPGSQVAFGTSQFNTIHFEYTSTLYGQQNNIQFSYQLAGFDKDWSGWSEKSEKDYTNLPAGNYTFKVRSRNNEGNLSKEVTFTFQILPPWYQTRLSYLIYFLLVAGVIHLIIKRQLKKHMKEQEKLKYLHQLELERNENEIVKLKNEKLEAEVNFKNQELATATMHLVQRGKVLTKIREVLSGLEQVPQNGNSAGNFRQVFSLLNEVEKRDADWDQFAIHFDQVHSNFLSDLKERHPNLTSNELKLCAYLKMNLSSKEIAQLMSITIRGVEVSRYRLRKKLNIPSEINLFDYLIQSISKESKRKDSVAVE